MARPDRGLTLLELIVAIALAGMVALGLSAWGRLHARGTRRVERRANVETLRGYFLETMDCAMTDNSYVTPTGDTSPCAPQRAYGVVRSREGRVIVSDAYLTAWREDYYLRALCEGTHQLKIEYAEIPKSGAPPLEWRALFEGPSPCSGGRQARERGGWAPARYERKPPAPEPPLSPLQGDQPPLVLPYRPVSEWEKTDALCEAGPQSDPSAQAMAYAVAYVYCPSNTIARPPKPVVCRDGKPPVFSLGGINGHFAACCGGSEKMLETVCSAPLLDAPQSTVKISAHPSPDRGDGRPEGRNSLEGTKDLSVIMTPDFTSCLRLDKEVDGRYSTTARCPTGYEIEKGDALCFDQGERLSNGRVDETTWHASCCGYPGKIDLRCKKKPDPTAGSLTDPALTRLGGENLPPL